MPSSVLLLRQDGRVEAYEVVDADRVRAAIADDGLAGQALDPSLVTSAPLALWLKADAITGLLDAAAIATWPDSSGQNNHATAAVGQEPTLRVRQLNNLPAVRLDGIDDFLSTALTFSGVTEATVLFVCKNRVNPVNADNRFTIIGDAANGAHGIRCGSTSQTGDWSITGFSEGQNAMRNGASPIALTTPSIITYQRSVAKNFIRALQNGAEFYRVTHTSGSVNPKYSIGRRHTTGFEGFYDGDLFEVLIFHGVVNDAELRGLHAYLALKWGLTAAVAGQLATEATLSAINAKLPATIGQKASSASSAVVLSSEQEVFLAAGRNDQTRYLNQIRNPSAEAASPFGAAPDWYSSYSGADPAPSVTRVTGATDAPEGSAYGRLSIANNGASGAVGLHWGHRDIGVLRVVGGQRYAFELSFKALRALTNVRLRVTFYPAIGSDTGSVLTDQVVLPMAGTGAFERLRREFVAPLGTSTVVLGALCDTPGTSGNLFDVDDVRLYALPATSAMQAEDISAATRIAHMLAAHEQGASPNPVLREDSQGWGLTSSGTPPSMIVARVTDTRTGMPAFRVTSTATSAGVFNAHVRGPQFAVNVGQRIKIVARTRVLRAAVSINIGCWLTDSAGAYIAAAGFGPVDTVNVAANSIGVHTVDFVVPNTAGVKHIDPQVIVQYGSGVAAADLFQVEEMRCWVDGIEQRLDEISAKLPAALYLDRLKVNDRYTGEEYLEDQPGAGAVLNFTFTAAPDIAFVYSKSLASRATFNSVAPTATKGVMCDADVATPIILSGQTALKVFAPIGATVSVWGFRYT